MINSCKSIKDIELPKDDDRCAAILRTVIGNLKDNEKESGSRYASSSASQGYPNKVYALRQKMFGTSFPSNKTDSRAASSTTTISDSISDSNVKGPNKIYELRKVMFGSYS